MITAEEYLYVTDRALSGMVSIVEELAQHHGQMEITRDLLLAERRAG